MQSELDMLKAAIAADLGAPGVRKFMLGEPMQLTVKFADGRFSKKPHIGGEEFRCVDVYQGKKKSYIYVFKCVDATEYSTMEMTQSQAFEALEGFAHFILEELPLRPEMEGVRDAKQKELAMQKEKEVAELGNRYADAGFGSW